MISMVLVAVATAVPVLTQQEADRGAILLRRAADTLVVDRFIRTADTLKGSVQVKGQPRIDYFALLGPNETVRSLTIAIYAAGAAADAAPAQRVRTMMHGDTAVVETPAGTQRIATRAGAVPSFNNALAISELFTRRARLAGGVASIPYFSLSGGVTIDVQVRPLSADSVTVTIAQQVERLRIDPAGRILGGIIAGPNFEFVRQGPEAAQGLVVTLRDSSVAPATNYAAPAGAPYAAEDVRVAGPDGIVLGGTLTLPTNIRPPFPAVVTITGSGQQDRDEYIPFAGGIRLFAEIADTLGRRGIAVLRLDDRGMGASTGGVTTATSAHFADDTRAAIAFLRARRDIDGDRIALVGHSEGGAIAPMIAATDHRLRAIVTMAAPGEKGIEISMAQNKYMVDRDTTLSPPQRDSILRAARNSLDPDKQTIPWIKFWMGYDPAPVARNVTAPTLILQGETDRQVPMDQAEKLAALIRAGGNRDVTVRTFPSTNHLFVDDPSGDFAAYDRLKSNRIQRAVVGTLADWLALKLSNTTPRSPARTRDSLLLEPSRREWRVRAPAVAHLRFETTKGVFVLELHRDWGPVGADRVYNLARLGYYDDTRLHRVRADIAHFGIHGDPAVNAVWSKAELPDDAPRSTNRRGTFALAFPARPNSRTTQIYINKTDNVRSDADAFTVLGTVVEGMAIVDSLYAGYGEESGGGMRQGKQGPLLNGGNAFMDRTYPRLDRILRVTVKTVR
jgi:cyclophilin family peptidyl-prolyl cis-trans isomerase/pimeloyl-ACP methyl ester carboxylesterase